MYKRKSTEKRHNCSKMKFWHKITINCQSSHLINFKISSTISSSYWFFKLKTPNTLFWILLQSYFKTKWRQKLVSKYDLNVYNVQTYSISAIYRLKNRYVNPLNGSNYVNVFKWKWPYCMRCMLTSLVMNS